MSTPARNRWVAKKRRRTPHIHLKESTRRNLANRAIAVHAIHGGRAPVAILRRQCCRPDFEPVRATPGFGRTNVPRKFVRLLRTLWRGVTIVDKEILNIWNWPLNLGISVAIDSVVKLTHFQIVSNFRPFR